MQQSLRSTQVDMFPGSSGHGDISDVNLTTTERQVKRALTSLLNISGKYLPYDALLKIADEFPVVAHVARQHLNQNRRDDH